MADTDGQIGNGLKQCWKQENNRHRLMLNNYSMLKKNERIFKVI